MTKHVIKILNDNIAVKKLRDQFSDEIIEVSTFRDEVTIKIKSSALIPVCMFLRDDKELKYNFLMDLTSVDYPNRAERFEVVYHLYSLAHNRRLRLKTSVGADNLSIGSLTSVWKSSNWLEREVFDLMGINFQGHPDLRRIVLPDDWVGHPLRKDYPLKGPDGEGLQHQVETNG